MKLMWLCVEHVGFFGGIYLAMALAATIVPPGAQWARRLMRSSAATRRVRGSVVSKSRGELSTLKDVAY